MRGISAPLHMQIAGIIMMRLIFNNVDSFTLLADSHRGEWVGRYVNVTTLAKPPELDSP